MKRIAFNPRFVNAAGNDLISGKIHTIRQNYEYWKRFEGQDVALFVWEGKPYRSRQKVFCVKRIVSVQAIYFQNRREIYWHDENCEIIKIRKLSANDGFENWHDFCAWFSNYKSGKMAILHFTDFRY